MRIGLSYLHPGYFNYHYVVNQSLGMQSVLCVCVAFTATVTVEALFLSN